MRRYVSFLLIFLLVITSVIPSFAATQDWGDIGSGGPFKGTDAYGGLKNGATGHSQYIGTKLSVLFLYKKEKRLDFKVQPFNFVLLHLSSKILLCTISFSKFTPFFISYTIYTPI